MFYLCAVMCRLSDLPRSRFIAQVKVLSTCLLTSVLSVSTAILALGFYCMLCAQGTDPPASGPKPQQPRYLVRYALETLGAFSWRTTSVNTRPPGKRASCVSWPFAARQKRVWDLGDKAPETEQRTSCSAIRGFRNRTLNFADSTRSAFRSMSTPLQVI